MTPPPHAYFAAGDTSVGFTPKRVAYGCLPPRCADASSPGKRSCETILGVKLVEQLGGPRIFQPYVTHQLAHVGPVLLLDARVVVFAIGPRAGEAHRAPAPRE